MNLTFCLSRITQPCLRALSLVLIIFLASCAYNLPKTDLSNTGNWQPETYPSDVHLIGSARQAIAWRLNLVANAEDYIELQYFTWNSDTSALMLAQALMDAADRGVQVKVIVDDLQYFQTQWPLELDAHANLEIKIFNPFDSRKIGWLGRSLDFVGKSSRLNHRMHQKYFNVDGQAMIIGGRNIGDDYFGFSTEANFVDYDVLIRGGVIQAFEQNFETLWNSERTAYIHDLVSKHEDAEGSFAELLNQTLDANSEIVSAIHEAQDNPESPRWFPAQVTPIFDILEKFEDSNPYYEARVNYLFNERVTTRRDLVVSTPYLISPDPEHVLYRSFTDNGGTATVLTNSLSSNDSSFVTAYYKRYREGLMQAGVEIYELDAHADVGFLSQGTQTYYHSKALVVNESLSIVGSSNFDPRSNFLNLEHGLAIESQAFALSLKAQLLEQHESRFWALSFNENDEIIWRKGEQVLDKDPEYPMGRKILDWFVRVIGIEPQV